MDWRNGGMDTKNGKYYWMNRVNQNHTKLHGLTALNSAKYAIIDYKKWQILNPMQPKIWQILWSHP